MSSVEMNQKTGMFQVPKVFLDFWDWFKRQAWYLHPRLHLPLMLTASRAYRLLEENTKPNIQRLEYRKLFLSGRRYHLFPKANGEFQLMTSHKVWWHPRARTRSSTVMQAQLENLDDTSSRLSLRSNIRLTYLLDVVPLPLFFSSIVIYVEHWEIWLKTFLILALFILSWLGHRFNAILEAYEMRNFVETILENYAPPPPPKLSDATADVVYEKDFAEVWDKFVEEKSQE